MAAPLFVASEAVLKSKLRLSAVPASALDTEAIIDEAILCARIRMYREIGSARVAVLLTTAFTDTPTTDAQIARALANTVEVKIVYCALLRALPNTFMDASGDVNTRWNEEAPIRERSSMELEDELRRCEDQITQDLQDLNEDDLEDCNDIQVFDGTADCPAPRIGMSLNPNYRKPPCTD